MGGSSFAPQSGFWQWFRDDAPEPIEQYAALRTRLVYGDPDAILRLRHQVRETGGKSSNNLETTLQYSPNAGANWYNLGPAAQWDYADGQATNGGTVTSFKLTFSNSYGQYIEDGAQVVSYGANGNVENDFAIRPTANVQMDTTFHFRVLLGGTTIPLVSAEEHPSVTLETIFTPRTGPWRWYADDASDPTTSLGNENETPEISDFNAIYRLRFQVAEQGGVASDGTIRTTLRYTRDGENWEIVGPSGHWNWTIGKGWHGDPVESFKLSGSDTAGLYLWHGGTFVSYPANSRTEHDFSLTPTEHVERETLYRFQILFSPQLGGVPIDPEDGATWAAILTEAEPEPEPVLATADLDALLSTQRTATADLDALLRAQRPAAASLDAVIVQAGAALETTAGLDALLRATRTAGTGTDALLQSGRSGTTALDALIQRAEREQATSLDVLLRAARSAAVGLDALVWATRAGTLSADALLQASRDRTVGLDALVRAARATTGELDAYVYAVLASSTAVDATLSATGDRETALDVLLQAVVSRTLSLDAIVVQAGQVLESVELDALLQAARQAQAQVDALVAQARAQTVGLDGVLLAGRSQTAALDALIQTAATATAALDALVRVIRTAEVGLDARLYQPRANTTSLDALLRAQRTAATSLDAVIVQAGAALETVALDALLLRTGLTRPVGLDGLLAQAYTSTAGLDALASALRVEAVGLDAIVEAAGLGLVSLDALLELTRTQTVGLDALVALIGTGAAGLDAVLGLLGTQATTLDALVWATLEAGVGLDAIIEGLVIPKGCTFTAAIRPNTHTARVRPNTYTATNCH